MNALYSQDYEIDSRYTLSALKSYSGYIGEYSYYITLTDYDNIDNDNGIITLGEYQTEQEMLKHFELKKDMIDIYGIELYLQVA